MSTSPERLQKFVAYCQQHIEGKEKQEAQIFLEKFFQAFGHEGTKEVGATLEQKVKRGSKKGNTGYADLVWKPRVLIEMKKRGEDLKKHYSQAFEYWTRLVPDRPRYVILCNFDEFWIFDFDTQLDEPVDTVALAELPERVSAFGFMETENRTPVFNNNQVEVTEKAARRMGELFRDLYRRGERDGFDRITAQRFILQCVLAMFAEKRKLLPEALFVACVQDCLNGESSYDVLGGLFREMNTPGITPKGRYAGVDYFNGGLFATVHPIELTDKELEYLDVVSRQDWSKVRPAIFGNIFEGTADADERHAYGMHYTSEADIMKIVRPTISRYWEEKLESANTIPKLEQLQLELQSYKVLDPACGSGNFLYVAYQELKRIEKELLDKLASRRRSDTLQQQMGLVTPLQFYGMDLNPFAVELARVTLMIARKVAIDKYELSEPALPLDTLDSNIVCEDALFTDWVKADAIIGNPPFLGGHLMRQEIGNQYVDRLFEKFSDIKNQQIDIASYWFRIAHDNLPSTGRSGLVGTNSISQGKSRVASLDYVTHNQGYIHEAISSQPWSGEAKVHVSIVNWSKEEPENYYLNNKQVKYINSSLTPGSDVSTAEKLDANKDKCFRGVETNGSGFFIEEQETKEWILTDPKNKVVLKQFLMGTNLARNPHCHPERWVIDFSNLSIEEASNYKIPFNHVKTHVKPQRDKSKEVVIKENWWKFRRFNPSLRVAISSLNSSYFVVPRVSKWIIFVPVLTKQLPGDSTNVVASEDFYILGILTSNVHRQWIKAQSSTLKGDTRYTPTTCFETFPFPQTPSQETVQQIRATATELHDYRSTQMEKKQWGITKLYNAFFHEPTSQLYKLHKKLDKLVLKAYDFNPEDDILEKLLDLNLELAEKEKNGEEIIGCWSPFSSG